MIVSSRERRKEMVTGWVRAMDLMRVRQTGWGWVSSIDWGLDLVRRKQRVMETGLE